MLEIVESLEQFVKIVRVYFRFNLFNDFFNKKLK